MSSQASSQNPQKYPGHGHYIPFIVFVVLTWLPTIIPRTILPGAGYIFYAAKTVITACLLWHFRKYYVELNFRFHWSAPLAGILVIIAWVGLDDSYPLLGMRVGFDPIQMSNHSLNILIVFFRLAGAVLVVPIMEELFFRSWMARWIIDPNFMRIPVGAFSWPSLVITTGLFALGHLEWLPGILAGLVFHGYVLWKKRLGDAIVAHAVANLALGIYVLKTQRWDFW